MNIETMDINRVAAFSGNSGIQIIDLRSVAAYRRDHIPGAISVPYERVANDEYLPPRAVRLFFYCENGSMSYVATKKYTERGYRCVNLLGGYRRYYGKKERIGEK